MSSIQDGVEGLKPVDPKLMEEFRTEMETKVIPEVIQVLEERNILAVEDRSRHRPIEILSAKSIRR